MRTQTEIINRIKQVQKNDLFGFESQDLMRALSFDSLKQFLKDDHGLSEEEWEEDRLKSDDEINEGAKKYLHFAFDKALYHRGLSAGRSISHYRAWLWLIGEDELVEFIDDENNYSQYGAPILAKIAQHYGVDLPDDEDFQAMMNGDVCPSCRCGDQSGCGR